MTKIADQAEIEQHRAAEARLERICADRETLGAQLATVTAERDATTERVTTLSVFLITERAAHAETRAERDAAIENQCAANLQWQTKSDELSKWDELCAAHAETCKALEQLRSELDVSEARVKELEVLRAQVQHLVDVQPWLMAENLVCALEESLRGI